MKVKIIMDSKNSGFETAILALPTKVFEHSDSSKCHDVEMVVSKPHA